MAPEPPPGRRPTKPSAPHRRARSERRAPSRANTKDEDPTRLLNEGLRYRDLATGVFISRDPAGFVDGPNVYTYVRQNPWSHYDPVGLFIAAIAEKLGERFGSNPIVEAMAPHTEVVVNTTQNILAVASMVPALGKVADGLSAGISAADGNYGEAAATAGGGSAGKLLAKLRKARLLGPGGELSRIIKEGGEQVQKNAEKVTKSAREATEQAAKQADEAAPAVTKVDPNTLELSHPAKLSTPFSNPKNGTVYDLAEALKKDPSLADKIPPVEVAKIKGKTYSANNRRTRAFQEAGVPIPTMPASKEQLKKIKERKPWKK